MAFAVGTIVRMRPECLDDGTPDVPGVVEEFPEDFDNWMNYDNYVAWADEVNCGMYIEELYSIEKEN